MNEKWYDLLVPNFRQINLITSDTDSFLFSTKKAFHFQKCYKALHEGTTSHVNYYSQVSQSTLGLHYTIVTHEWKVYYYIMSEVTHAYFL